MNSPICVLVPVFRQQQHLGRAFASVLWQLGYEDEIIIVEDEPKPHKEAEILRCAQPRVIWIRNPVRQGISRARNQGILRSRSEWIKFLDADDVLAPFAVNAVRSPFTQIPPEIQVVTGGIHRIIEGRYEDYINGAEAGLNSILNWNPMLPSATFVRREALLTVGMFDERIDYEEDWDLWLKLHERYGRSAFMVVEQPIAFYWIDQAERKQKVWTGMIEGMSVRDYFRLRYGVDPK
jgi:glycosyltransferase involved in cell wall biosynthesis